MWSMSRVGQSRRQHVIISRNIEDKHTHQCVCLGCHAPPCAPREAPVGLWAAAQPSGWTAILADAGSGGPRGGRGETTQTAAAVRA